MDRIRLTGDDILLPPHQGLSLGLVIHELATNVVKYGALSVNSGDVSVNWSWSETSFRLHWMEKGGPAPIPR